MLPGPAGVTPVTQASGCNAASAGPRRQPVKRTSSPPRLGEHDEEILASLGFDAAQRREILAGNDI